jgi:hypothetical protein
VPRDAGSAVSLLSLRESEKLSAQSFDGSSQGMFLYQSPPVWVTKNRGELKNRTRFGAKGDAA